MTLNKGTIWTYNSWGTQLEGVPIPPAPSIPSLVPITQMWDDISSLCTTGLQPIILTGIIRQLLIRHFSTEDNLTELLKPYVWNIDEKTTKIIIEPNIKINWKLIEMRPAIIIKRDTITAQKLAIDDFKSVGLAPGDGEHFIRGKVGSHTIFCIAENGGLAEILGQEVSDELTEFAPLIRRDLHFNRFEEAQVGEVMSVEESDKHFLVPVSVAYAYVKEWRLTPEAPWHKFFSVGTT